MNNIRTTIGYYLLFNDSAIDGQLEWLTLGRWEFNAIRIADVPKFSVHHISCGVCQVDLIRNIRKHWQDAEIVIGGVK